MTKAEELKEQVKDLEIKENHELIKRSNIDSVVELVETEKGYFLSIGQYRLSDFFETKEMALDFKNDTGFLLNLVSLLINKTKN